VRLTNPTPNQLCISFTQSTTAVNGATTHYESHIAKATLEVATRTPAAPFTPLHCAQPPVSNADAAGWFAPGGTILSNQSSMTRRGQTSCHPLTGCVATEINGQIARFAHPDSLVVGTGGLAVRVADYALNQRVDRPLTAGEFTYAGADDDGVPWELHGSTHADRCIESLATGQYWHSWFYATVSLTDSSTARF
jgi:hypothetical protein